MARFNEVYKVFQPHKYTTTKNLEVLREALNSENYCLQLKRDGSSYILARDLDGSVHLYGDRISKKTGEVIDKIDNLSHVKNWGLHNLPFGSQLLVEVCFGKTSADTNSIMLALPDKANQRQKGNLAEIYVFDILFWDGQPIYKSDFGDRWFFVNSLPQLKSVPSWLTLAETVYDDKDIQIADWIARGEEGGVLKLLSSDGRHSAAHHVREIGATAARPAYVAFKIKQVDTIDAIIIGVQMPTQDYTGKNPDTHQYRDADDNPINRLYALNLAKAFIIGVYDKGQTIPIGTVSSGLDDQLRFAAAKDPEDFIGKVIEVTCMSKDNVARSLRHPRFKTFRPDKAANQCLLEEVFS